MLEDYQYNKTPNLQKGQIVGVIANYFTEQFLKRDFKTKKMILGDVPELIENHHIEVVFVEKGIYESDHEWVDYEFEHIIEYISKFNVNIIEIYTGKKEKSEISNFSVDMCSSNEVISYNDNGVSMPLMINEKLINPVNDRKTNDIVFLKLGEVEEDKEISQYLKIMKPSYEEVVSERITRKVIKKITTKIKNSRVIYVYYSEAINDNLLKYIELAAVFQNTIIILDPRYREAFEFAFQSPVKESNVNYIQTFTNQGVYTDKKAIGAGRKAFLKNTLSQYPSLNEVLKGNVEKKEIEVSVITSTMRKWTISEYIQRLNSQLNIKLEVILLTHGFELTNKEKEQLYNQANFELKIISENRNVIFGVCLNKCIDLITNEYFTKMDDDDYYYPNYLLDSWIAKTYSNAEVVGKHSQFVYLEGSDLTIHRFKQHKNRFSEYVAGATIFCETEFIKKYMFSEIPKAVDSDILRRIRQDGGQIYCGHPYEFCIFRADDKSAHTWTVPDTHLFRSAEILFYNNPEQTLTID